MEDIVSELLDIGKGNVYIYANKDIYAKIKYNNTYWAVKPYYECSFADYCSDYVGTSMIKNIKSKEEITVKIVEYYDYILKRFGSEYQTDTYIVPTSLVWSNMFAEPIIEDDSPTMWLYLRDEEICKKCINSSVMEEMCKVRDLNNRMHDIYRERNGEDD